MDFQNRVGSKAGSGGVADWAESNVARRERLRKLALETIDLAKDPYILRNHLGSYECKLCLTLHTNEGSYLAHTQGKKHQANLSRRQARDSRQSDLKSHYMTPTQLANMPAALHPPKAPSYLKIGRPGYQVLKVRDPDSKQHGFLFTLELPLIGQGVLPRHRFMGAYEQRVDQPDHRWQFLVVAAEPYETIAFKIPAREVDRGEGKFLEFWDPDTKQLAIQMLYRHVYGAVAR